MNLSNYTSKMPMNRVFDGITKMLVSHGAQEISYSYTDGLASGISFRIETARGVLSIKLPVRMEKVEQVFRTQGIRYQPDQPYRTGWKNIHDWIRAQLALIDIEMVKMEEVFLPYIVNQRGEALFERMEEKGFLLEGGE